MSTATGGVAWTYREMGRLGLNFGSAGNVSRRHGPGMLITPSGATTDQITDDALVEMTLQGAVCHDNTPSSEWAMHAAIYEAYPQAGAVVHSHADACTALACLREPLPPFHYMFAGFGGDDVRCTAYTTFGTRALADLAVEALRNCTACLLGNHGMTCHGRALGSGPAGNARAAIHARPQRQNAAAAEPGGTSGGA